MAKAVYVGVGSKARKMKKAYIGIGGKARKVKKMYIGVGGKARLCYSAELEKVGMATALSTTRYDMRAATVGKYALFAGGYISKSSFGYSVSSSVDAYNTSLTKSTPTELSCKRCGHAAASVGGYALFAGGASSYNLLGFYENLVSAVDAYDASLTKTSAAILSTARTGLAATTVGDYAIFSGGGVADFCDASLTRSSIGTSMTGYDMGAATIGDYALFAGGHSGNTIYDSVEVYTA